jgi:hypothetical protein
MNRKKRRPLLVVILLVILLTALLVGRMRIRTDNQHSIPSRSEVGFEEIDRHPQKLIFTKHARCRMDCRQIDESEVKEIIEKGTINYNKSDPSHKPDPTYALEGITHDKQHVRLVVAPSEHELVVITCIDLDHEWSCHCD